MMWSNIPGVVYPVAPVAKKPFDEAGRAEILRLADAGFIQAEIAVRVGQHQTTISKVLRQAGRRGRRFARRMGGGA